MTHKIINILAVIISLYSGLVAITAEVNYLALPVFLIGIVILLSNNASKLEDWLS